MLREEMDKVNKLYSAEISEKEVSQSYKDLLSSKAFIVIVADLIKVFDPFLELHTPGDPYTTAYNNGTVAPVKYIINKLRNAENDKTHESYTDPSEQINQE